MKKATLYGIGVTAIFYVSLGCVGYAAFGNDAPGNILTGFYEPFWLVDIANIAVLVHLLGAFQVLLLELVISLITNHIFYKNFSSSSALMFVLISKVGILFI